jgi:hypothetical protein
MSILARKLGPVLNELNDGGGQVDCGEEVSGCFVVTCGNRSALLELAEESSPSGGPPVLNLSIAQLRSKLISHESLGEHLENPLIEDRS